METTTETPVSTPAAAAETTTETGSEAAPVAASPSLSGKDARMAALREASKILREGGKEPVQETKATVDKVDSKVDKPARESTEELVGLIRDQRALKAAQEAVRLEREALKADEPDLVRTRAAKAAIAKGDRLGAVRALFPDTDITKELLWDITKAIEAGELDPAPAPGQDIEKMVLDKLAAIKKSEADELAANEQQKSEGRQAVISAKDAELGAGFGASVVKVAGLESVDGDTLKPVIDGYADYVVEMNKQFDPAKYPALREFPVDHETVIACHQRLWKDAKGASVPPALVLQELESQLVARLHKALPGQVTTPSKPSPTVTAAMRSDPGRPLPPAPGKQTLLEKRDAIRQRLRERRP